LLRPFANTALAGDWIGEFPATIENAVTAGERAAALLARPPLRSRPLQPPASPLPAGKTA
jgi:hypothetical protein